MLRDSLSHAVRCVGSMRDLVVVCAWTTVTTSWVKHADKMRMRKKVCEASVLFTHSPTPRFFFFSKITNLHRLQVVCNDEPSEAARYFEPISLLEALDRLRDWAVTIILLVWPEVERIDRIVAHSLRCSVRSKHFCLSAVRDG